MRALYLILGTVLIAVLLVRFGLTLAGFKLRPWLPQSGRRRFYIDMALSALVLVFGAVLLGIHRSFGLALVIALLAGGIATALEAIRARQPR